jgi:hypothetical protein
MLGVMTTTPEWIAETNVVFVYPDGKRVPGRIAIAAPVRRDRDCACAIALDGMQPMKGPIYGEDTLQALLLAARFMGMTLHDFLDRGGRVLHPAEDTDVPLDAYFGALHAPPRPPGRGRV